MSQRFLVLRLVGGEAVFAQNEFSQVQGETVRVFQREHIYARNLRLALFLGLIHQFAQQTDTLVQGAEESLFFAADNRSNLLLLFLQFRIGFAQVCNQLRNQFVQERLALAQERVTVADGSAQDTTNHVTGLLVARQLSVGDSECYGADMVCDDAHGDVHILFLTVFVPRQFTNLAQHRLEHVRIIVRGLALNGTHQTLETHARVNHFLCQRLQAAVCFAVVLHEHDVPNLNHLRMVFVHQLASGNLGFLLIAAAVHMNLGARAARSRIAHFPEVIVLVAVQDMVLRQMFLPDTGCFVISAKTLFCRALEHRGIQVLRVQFQYIHQVFPGPVDGFLLEVIAKRPVAQHLEHRVVVRVVSHLLKVIMFAAHAKTFLAVCYARIFDWVIPQNNALPRVHARVGKHQRRVIFYHHRSTRHYLMPLACHKVQKGLPNLLTCHSISFSIIIFYVVQLPISDAF